MSNFRTLKEFFIENRRGYAIGILCLLSTSLLQVSVPKFLGIVIDVIALKGAFSELKKYIIILLLIGLALVISRYFWRIYMMGVARKLEYYLRNKIFAHLQTLDPKFFDNQKTGDLMALVTNDVKAVRMAVAGGAIMITDAVIITTFAIIIMVVTINPSLTIAALLPFPIIALAVTRFGKRIHERFKSVQAAFASLTDIVQENISAVRVVKAFVLEKSQINKFNNASQKIIDKNMNLVKVSGFLYPFVQYIASISFLIALGFGSYLVINQSITIGDFVAFNGYLMILTWPMMAIGYVINMLQRGTASMARINALLDQKPEITDSDDPDSSIEKLSGDIKFANLQFAYPETGLVLENFSLDIKKGEVTAILGKTGSGKSTIADLLLRLYEVEQENALCIDGRDIKKIPLKVLRNSIGYVPQDSFLFSATIKENIAFGNPDASMEKIISVAKIAAIYEDIVLFPDGFETIVGERGITLSGGQKQRVAIARALLTNPSILILDDSLSAVDTATEETILNFLKAYREQRTTIIISHRISAVKGAGKIIMLESGKIVQEGSHQELIQDEGGLYYRLYHLQLLENERPM